MAVQMSSLVEDAQGAIFLCTSRTFLECTKGLIFGAPKSQWHDFVVKLRPHLDVAFLWSSEKWLKLYGMFEILETGFPVSEAAFDGGYPAQVRVDWKYPKFDPWIST